MQARLEFYLLQIVKRATIFSFGALGLSEGELSQFILFLAQKCLYGAGGLPLFSERIQIDSLFILRNLLFSGGFAINPVYGQPGHEADPSYSVNVSYPNLPGGFLRKKCRFFENLNFELFQDKSGRYRSAN
mmetsp:Transcript_6171/g.9960  ORF Transcript_6171/g.9960 Transcript_6171/m.9960 type:complete len:131 (+) Transcript_6171:3805-4197(+)